MNMNENMMSFEPNELRRQLSRLPRSHQLAFACACCERLLPNYRAFSVEENWGNPQLLEAALDQVWTSMQNGVFDPSSVKQLIANCEKVIPDSENFDSILTSAALDAGNAVVEILEASINDSLDGAVAVADLARDTVDMYIQAIEDLEYSDPGFEEKILRHPLMVNELARQRRDLDFLKLTTTIDDKAIRRLRELNKGSILELPQS